MPRSNNKEMIKKEDEFAQRIIDVARVTRVMAGGKRMKFRVCLAIGDKKGRVGIGIAKGADVTLAMGKSLTAAKKRMIKVPIVNETIIHPVRVKFNAAKILLKPAPKGAGVKAGGPLRILCELAGIPNIIGKNLGSNNKINIAKATLVAFQSFKLTKGQEDNNVKAAGTVVSQSVEDKKPEVKKSFKDKIKDIIKKDK